MPDKPLDSGYARIDFTDRYLRVIHALMLRDMRTRFMGSYWGYVVQVLWPVTHMFVIAGAMAFRNVPSPFGGSTMVFAASGAVPALAFQYISREMMKGMVSNRPLIYYPQVKAFDIMFSRLIVEIVGSFLGVMLILGILFAFGDDPIPIRIDMAVGGYLAAMLIGAGMGTINVAIVQFFPGWMIGYILITILIYMASGVLFVSTDLPEKLYSIAKWNPIFQIVEWVRLGYDPTAPVKIDYGYIFMCICGTFTVGLLMERTISRSSS